MRLRGAITAIDGKTVTIAVRDGTTANVKLADNWGVSLVTPLTLADVKQGSFVGIASTGSDADRTALEVLVFPEALRGTGEGHYAWDLKPNSMMTNANVATVASASDGQSLKLDYKGGGTQTIKVKPGTPIVTFQPGQQSDAKVGAKVFVSRPEGGRRQHDGRAHGGRQGRPDAADVRQLIPQHQFGTTAVTLVLQLQCLPRGFN